MVILYVLFSRSFSVPKKVKSVETFIPQEDLNLIASESKLQGGV